jgi:hypothetical protein
MKAKNMDGDGNSPGGFLYDKLFRDYRERFRTDIFPHFDFRSSSIIWQSNSFDCGLAAVANSMAFLKHLKSFNFDKLQMEEVSINLGEGQETRFYLYKEYSLQPERIMT